MIKQTQFPLGEVKPKAIDKIAMYLTALKERYSKDDWKEFHPNELRKEFNLTAIMPTVLIQNKYLSVKRAGVRPNRSFVKLNESIFTVRPETIHKRLKEYGSISIKRNKKIKQKTKKPSTSIQPVEITDYIINKNLDLTVNPDFSNSRQRRRGRPIEDVKKSNEDFFKMIEKFHEPENKKELISLEEHDRAKSVFQPNGIACPSCGNELYDTTPNLIINNKKHIHCDCGFVGTRKA